MVASYDTIRQIHEVIKRNTNKEQRVKILYDLSKIKGNKSFTDTINRLIREEARGEG